MLFKLALRSFKKNLSLNKRTFSFTFKAKLLFNFYKVNIKL
jgi:hypothetical protein